VCVCVCVCVCARGRACVQRTVPVAVPGVVFLSGGQSEEHATLNLNMMNAMPAKKPWRLTFSFGRALQQTCLNVWQGEDKNLEAAQQAFLERCRVNGEAQVGGSGFRVQEFRG
jgi:fructose-bisphosphate aldolase class I